MSKKVQCQAVGYDKLGVKIKIIKAPLVDTRILRRIILDRARAVIL